MADASQLIVHYDPPRKGTDGRIAVERVGSPDRWSRPATAEGVQEARDYVAAARARGFSVNDLALAKARGERA